MKRSLALKTALLVSGLFLLCTPLNPAQAAGFATPIATESAVRFDLSKTYVPAHTNILQAAISRYESLSQKQVPAFRRTGIFRRWVHRQLLRFLPEVMNKADKEAMWALGLGIGSVLLFPLLGPAALYLGICALEDGTTKQTEATIGLVLGGLVTILLVLLVVLLFSFMGWTLF